VASSVGKILPPEEAVPLLLDRERSPVVAIDTEFEEGVPPSRASLRAISFAGGTPETGFFACAFVFEQLFARFTKHDWRWVLERLILPLFRDPERTIVMHPLKVDIQLLRARGLTEADTLCKLEDTIAMCHIWDDNLPHSLKDLGGCLLLAGKGATYRQTQNKIKDTLKTGNKLVKQVMRDIWTHYKEGRKNNLGEVDIDPSWPSEKRMALMLPPKMLKREVEAAVRDRVTQVILDDYEHRAFKLMEEYAADDTLVTLGVRYHFVRSMEPDAWPHVELETEITHPVVTEMEERGLLIDVPLLSDINTRMEEIGDYYKSDVVRRFTVEGLNDDPDKPFNPGSGDQIAAVVWGAWNMAPPPWTKSGGELKPQFRRAKDGLPKADKDILDYLANKGGPHSKDLAALRKWRQVQALISDPVRPLLELATADPENRIHATFWSTGARTGRFAHREPNVGNIPRGGTMPVYPRALWPAGSDPRKPLPGLYIADEKVPDNEIVWRVRSLRDCFKATPGMKYVSADLSQIENRIIAHVTQDPRMLWLYQVWDCAACGQSGRSNQPLHACPNCGTSDKEGKRDKTHPEQPILAGFSSYRDIHSLAAASVTAGGKSLFDKYGPKEGRNRGKTYNHAATYGMQANRVARNLGVSKNEASEGLKTWHDTFRGVKPLQARSRRDIEEVGYVTVLGGKKRRFPAQRLLNSSGNFRIHEWEGVIREAVNVRAQGGTALVIKEAMRRIRRRLKERAKTDPRFNDVWLLNQVHDEINYEAPEEIAEEVLEIVCWELEHAVELSVPVIAEGAIGDTWGQAH
jgi:DNA polymerase I-like protein with 3'-5' exonuclease and polymerase domains